MSTIMIVEDDHSTWSGVRRALEGAGYSVISRMDSDSAMETLKEISSVDLIVLEWVLPGSEGWDFLNEKRKASPLAAIPVLAITDIGIEINVPGLAATLTKPLIIELLLQKVKQLCPPLVL